MLKGLKSAIKWIVAILIICVAFVFLGNINGLDVNRTVITVNGSEITEDEYVFYVNAQKFQVLSEEGIPDEVSAKDFLVNGEIDGKPAADYIREEAIKQAVRIETGVVKAHEAGISLTEEEISQARSTDGLEETIKMYGVDKRTYADVMEKSQLVYKYYTTLSEEDDMLFNVTAEELKAGIDAEYALVQHILIQNKPEGATEVDAEYAAEAKKKAEDVLAKVTQGANFFDLVKDYNEDPGMESNPEGYLITKDGYTLDGQSQMVPEFTEGGFAVAVGEVNPKLVESSYGWHIVRRAEITEANANYIQIVQSVESTLSYDKYEEYLDAFESAMNIVKKDGILNKVKVKY